MPIMYPWQPTVSPLPVLQSLDAGGCVALPTESTYELVASALRPEAVANLREWAAGDVPAIVVSDEAQVPNWMPLLRGVGARLHRKAGPGPLIVRADGGFGRGLWSRLPQAARRLLVDEGQIGLRWPAYPIWTDLRAADMPLVSVPLASVRTAEEAAQVLGERAACVVVSEPAEFGLPPSVVQMNGRGYTLRREGGLTADLIHELSLCRILFVCTGNTCRSPMAEVLCAKLLADRLGCPVNDLKQHGFLVQSAGVAAMMGNEASPDAVTMAANDGADLTAHRSRPMTMEMLAWADHLFVMAGSHQQALQGLPILGLPNVRMLSPEDEDIADPIGSGPAEYRACADQIIQCLYQRLPELLES